MQRTLQSLPAWFTAMCEFGDDLQTVVYVISGLEGDEISYPQAQNSRVTFLWGWGRVDRSNLEFVC